MAKLKRLITKLQRAIVSCGFIVAVNTTQFYSYDQCRFIAIFFVTTPILTRTKYDEWKTKNYEIIRSASMVDVLETLQDIYKVVRDWKSQTQGKKPLLTIT